MSDPRRDRSDWLLALIVFLSLGALGHHKFGTIDAIQRLAVTKAIFHHHSVVTPEFGAVKYGPLQPVLMLPPYVAGFLTGKLFSVSGTTPEEVGYRFTAFLFTPLVVTAIFFRYLRVARRAGAEPGLALVSAYLLIWGTLLLPYSRLLFSEPLNALLVFLSFEAVLSFSSDAIPRAWPVFLWLSLLVLDNAVFALLYAVVAAAVVIRCLRTSREALPRTVAAALSFALATAAVWAIYNHARYGAVTVFGYGEEGFSGSLPEGLYALMLSIGRGILLYSPLTVVAFLFFLVAARHPAFDKTRWPLTVFWLGSALTLCVYGKWDIFEGGWCWGPRFLLPFIPVIHVAFPIVLSAAARGGRPAKYLAGVAVAAAIGINAWEFLGVYQDFERATFGSGAVPYRLSVFVPEYSAVLHNWSTEAAAGRLPQFFATAGIAYGLSWWAERRRKIHGA